MLRRCSWCGLTLGQAEPLDDLHVTHGICPSCSARVIDEFQRAQIASAKSAALLSTSRAGERLGRMAVAAPSDENWSDR